MIETHNAFLLCMRTAIILSCTNHKEATDMISLSFWEWLPLLPKQTEKLHFTQTPTAEWWSLHTKSKLILVTMKRIYSIQCTLNASDSVYFKWQNKKSKYLAVAIDNTVNIYNRHGEHVDQINLFGFCIGLSWNLEGDLLAIITDRSPLIFLWNASTHRLQQVDSGIKEALSLIIWSISSQSLLFIGTAKGSILIYNNQTSRKIPILGKHTKKITSGAWSEANQIALVGEDKVLTVSNEQGDTLCINSLKGEPSNVKFVHSYYDEKVNSSEPNSVALVINKRLLYVVSIEDSENPFIMTFQDWYGSIVDYYCYANGNLFVAFNSGLVVTVSTCFKNFGAELYQIKAHKDLLNTISVCPASDRVATCSENNVKIFNLQDHSDIEHVLTVDDEPSIELLDWTSDGQLLAAVSSTGTIHVYLSQLKILGDNYGTSLAFLSSLLEVTVFNVHEDVQDSVIIVRIEIEPSHIAIGPFHLAVAMNNKIWFYSLTGNEIMNMLTSEHEYVGIVRNVKLNGNYVAVQFTNGTLQFHSIEKNKQDVSNGRRDVYVYPDANDASVKKSNVTSLCLTNDFLIYSLANGQIAYFVIEDWNATVIYRHSYGVQTIESNLNGTRLVLLDERNDIFVYNVYNESCIQIAAENVPPKPLKILWESWLSDKCVFTICDSKFIHVYSAPRNTVEGAKVEYVGKMKIPTGQFPLLLYNGVIVCQTKSGKTSNFILSTHDYSFKSNASDLLQREVLRNIIKLRRFQDAMKICSYLNDDQLWEELGTAALFDLEVDVAIRVYQQLKKFGLVHSLLQYKQEEEQSLFCGYLAEMLSKFDLAQKLFLSSSKPLRALEMRKNLFHWDEALALARHLAPNEISFISRELAEHEEYAQNYQKALDNFEIAIDTLTNPDSDSVQKHIRLCKSGISRNAIRCGDIKRGVSIATELNEPELVKECAFILESLKYLQEAAVLFEKCNMLDKAAELYLKVKNVTKLTGLLSNIEDGEILCQYAKMKENERQFRAALEIYLKAGQWLDVVRIYLDYLNNPGEAVKVVREKRSIEGAKLIAKYFQKRNDMTTAIEFLVISKCFEDAYNLAKTINQMDTYADILEDYGDQQNQQDFRSVAIFYEQENNALKAGKFFCLAKLYKKGVKLLLQAASNSIEHESESLTLAIDAAANAKDEQITRLILDFLMGETDGLPKDFKYLFKLYMKLEHYKEAAKTAIIISREEQNLGNYRNSHQLLFGMCSELRRNDIAIPSEMSSGLLLIHSYMLAKIWIRAGNHKNSSKLLIRVGDNINKFPSHSIQILTTLVIECQRAGFHKNALKFAQMLMKSETRDKVDPKFKRKIEILVRKSPGVQLSGEELQDELEIASTPCPYCDDNVKENEFTCYTCRNAIPYCIASGLHIVKQDLTKCPNCHFPAIMSHFLKILSFETQCPMCNGQIDISQIKMALVLDDILHVNR